MTKDQVLRQAIEAMRETLDVFNATVERHAYEDELRSMAHLRAAFRAAEAALAEPAAEPVAFDHSVGEGRFQVVRGSFWWHIKIGNCTALYGKFNSKLAAEDMALKLLTAYRDGAFEQYKSRAVRAEPLKDDE